MPLGNQPKRRAQLFNKFARTENLEQQEVSSSKNDYEQSGRQAKEIGTEQPVELT
jgi:hypothetical protein